MANGRSKGAFGPGPARGTLPRQMKVDGFLDKGLANSFHGGDKSTGSLTSLPFTVERKYITFLIGGGGWAKETCINLIVDGHVVRTATGPNTNPGGSEALAPAAWDVAEFAGRQARLAIVDARTGGWGHINVDHIVQSDSSAVPSAAPPPHPVLMARTLAVARAFSAADAVAFAKSPEATLPTLGLAQRHGPAGPVASQPERRLGRWSTGAVADGVRCAPTDRSRPRRTIHCLRRSSASSASIRIP